MVLLVQTSARAMEFAMKESVSVTLDSLAWTVLLLFHARTIVQLMENACTESAFAIQVSQDLIAAMRSSAIQAATITVCAPTEDASATLVSMDILVIKFSSARTIAML